MVNCSVLGCKNRTQHQIDNISFHVFPKNLALKKLWVQTTGRTNWEPTFSSRICSEHFDNKCIRKTEHKAFLRSGTVPTINLHKSENVPVTLTTTNSTQEKANTVSSIKVSPQMKKLIEKLKQKTIVALRRKKEIAILRTKNWRLQKRNAELTKMIEQLKCRPTINEENATFLIVDIDSLNKEIP